MNQKKEILGIRKNVFLSCEAFDELTELGCKKPLQAHETTLLRATFSLMRYKAINQETEYRKIGGKCFAGFKYEMLESNCPACAELDGSVTSGEHAAILPLQLCVCETANYGLRPHFDWLANID